MAAVRSAVERLPVAADIRPGKIETDEVWIGMRSCDLLIADPVWESTVTLDAVWAGGIEVNPLSHFQAVQRPTIVLDIRVVRLSDAGAASTAASRVRATKCPTDDFQLNIGLASARRAARTVQIGSTSGWLTTATVRRINPGNELSVTYLPGDARLIFARGPLLISIEALALLPRKLNSATKITSSARENVLALATEIMTALPLSPTPDPTA